MGHDQCSEGPIDSGSRTQAMMIVSSSVPGRSMPRRVRGVFPGIQRPAHADRGAHRQVHEEHAAPPHAGDVRRNENPPSTCPMMNASPPMAP